MKLHTATLLGCIALGATAGLSSARAQMPAPAMAPVSSQAPAPVATGRDALYQSLGGAAGVTRLTDDFLDRLLADPRMNPFFRDIDGKVFKSQLAAQICEVSGGPCHLKGKDMKTVHAGQDIRKTDFNALVEVLQQSMDAQGITFADQNRLLARLAPMHRDIINTP